MLLDPISVARKKLGKTESKSRSKVEVAEEALTLISADDDEETLIPKKKEFSFSKLLVSIFELNFGFCDKSCEPEDEIT